MTCSSRLVLCRRKEGSLSAVFVCSLLGPLEVSFSILEFTTTRYVAVKGGAAEPIAIAQEQSMFQNNHDCIDVTLLQFGKMGWAQACRDQRDSRIVARSVIGGYVLGPQARRNQLAEKRPQTRAFLRCCYSPVVGGLPIAFSASVSMIPTI